MHPNLVLNLNWFKFNLVDPNDDDHTGDPLHTFTLGTGNPATTDPNDGA